MPREKHCGKCGALIVDPKWPRSWCKTCHSASVKAAKARKKAEDEALKEQ